MEREWLEERWYKFYRAPCLDGYIDIWQGDMINNPNNDNKHLLSLNSSASYFRLNDRPWLNDSSFVRGFKFDMLELAPGFPAQEIWDDYLLHF